MRDVGPICSWFVHGDDVVVAEHYDVSIYLLMYGIPPGPRGSLLFSVDPMYGASSVHRVQLNNKHSFDDYTSHTIPSSKHYSQQWYQ